MHKSRHSTPSHTRHLASPAINLQTLTLNPKPRTNRQQPSTLESARPRKLELLIHTVEDGSIQDSGNVPFEPRARQGALEVGLCTAADDINPALP